MELDETYLRWKSKYNSEASTFWEDYGRSLRGNYDRHGYQQYLDELYRQDTDVFGVDSAWFYLRIWGESCVRNDSYYPVLYLSHLLLSGGDLFRDRLEACFSDVPVTEQLDLFRLCEAGRAFLLEQMEQKYPGLLELGMPEFETPADMKKTWTGFILKQVFQITPAPEGIDLRTVDELARAVREQERDDPQRALLGAMLTLVSWSEYSSNKAVGLYALSRYVLPAMASLEWLKPKGERSKVRLEWIIQSDMITYVFTLLNKLVVDCQFHLDRVYCNWDMNEEEAQDFIREVLEYGPGKLPIFQPCMERCKGQGELGLNLKRFLDAHHDDIRETVNMDEFGNVLAYTMMLLYCSGQTQASCDTMIQYYHWLDERHQNMNFVRALLIRNALEAKDMDSGLCLRGYLSQHSSARTCADRQIRELMPRVLSFLREAEAFIKEHPWHDQKIINAKREKKCRGKGEKDHYEMVYGDGHFLASMEQLAACCQKDVQPECGLYRRLMDTMFRLTYKKDGRVCIHMEGRGDQDVSNVLPASLQRSGELLLKQLRQWQYMQKETSLQSYLSRKTELYLDRHVQELQEQHMGELTLRLKEIREKNSTGADEEAQSQERMREAQLLVEELSGEMVRGGARQSIMEMELEDCEKAFCRTYGLGKMDLLDRVDMECRMEIQNDLLTSRLVFDMLDHAEDKSQLDFSAALISLTKAVEQVLNKEFAMMKKVGDFPELDQRIRGSLLFNGRANNRLTMGAGIGIFRDYESYVTRGQGDGVTLEGFGAYPVSHFKRWKGDEVFDFAGLSRFSDLSFRVDGREARHNGRTSLTRQEVRVHFTKDADYNRLVLVAVLTYLKDHYRNLVAHKDPVSRKQADACYQLLIQSENLLWILLWLIRVDS